MGILSFFTFRKEMSHARNASRPFTIDLTTFQVGDTKLGERPSEMDFFAKALQKSDVFEKPTRGIELAAKDGFLDYAFLTIDNFDGQFMVGGTPVGISQDSTETTIRDRLGEPYWIDRSDGEIIMFYEYSEGSIELQFEFPDSRSLGFVTLSRDGVLSCKEQRKSYGMDKPWPPIN